MLTVGMRVKVIDPISKYKNAEGVILKIDKTYMPDTTVLLDEMANKIPEIGLRYFWQNELEEVK